MSNNIFPVSKVAVSYNGIWDVRDLSHSQLVKLRQILLDTKYTSDVVSAIKGQYSVLESLANNDSATSLLRLRKSIMNLVGQWFVNSEPRGQFPGTSKTDTAKEWSSATLDVGELPLASRSILVQMEKLQNDLDQCRQNNTRH